MKKRKILVTKEQIELLAEQELSKLKKEDFGDMIGEPEDRRIKYPDPGDMEAIKSGITDRSIDNEAIDPREMESPPEELLEYLDKIEEAKSILSRVAARENNEKIKTRIYSHYEKAQKLAFEMIKEFGIVH